LIFDFGFLVLALKALGQLMDMRRHRRVRDVCSVGFGSGDRDRSPAEGVTDLGSWGRAPARGPGAPGSRIERGQVWVRCRDRLRRLGG
jgi:hypothetical protein